MDLAKQLATAFYLIFALTIPAVAFIVPVARAMKGAEADQRGPVSPQATCVGNSGDPNREPPSLPSHLIVLVHGLAGTPEDLTYLKKTLEKQGEHAGILVHAARCNDGKTKDGVAQGGSRLAEEVREVVRSNPSLDRISLVGNSLGGLYSRYAIRELYSAEGDSHKGAAPAARRSIDERSSDIALASTLNPVDRAALSARKGTLAGLRPSVFMSVATPHLGILHNTYLPLPRPAQPLVGVVVGQTGYDLMLSTKGATAAQERRGGPLRWRTSRGAAAKEEAAMTSEALAEVDGKGTDAERRRSLLYRMATSTEFLAPLHAFSFRRAYANRRGDFMVPYGTAAFVAPNEGDGADELDAEESARGSRSAKPGAIDRVLGMKEGLIVGVSRTLPTAPTSRAGQDIAGNDTAGNDRGSSTTGEDATSPSSADAMMEGSGLEDAVKKGSLQAEMAAALNGCGWDKVSVDFGGLLPLSHNKICALSRTSTMEAMYGSGKNIMDHAAKYLLDADREVAAAARRDEDGC